MNSDLNQNVKCDVATCSYNTNGSNCSATSIHVGGASAHCCRDTRCDTYQEK